MADNAITPAEERQLDGLIKELKRRVKNGALGLEPVLLQLESMTQTLRAHLTNEEEKYVCAQKRREWLYDWYLKMGFDIAIPLPLIPDEEFDRRAKKYQALFYRPATFLIS